MYTARQIVRQSHHHDCATRSILRKKMSKGKTLRFLLTTNYPLRYYCRILQVTFTARPSGFIFFRLGSFEKLSHNHTQSNQHNFWIAPSKTKQQPSSCSLVLSSLTLCFWPLSLLLRLHKTTPPMPPMLPWETKPWPREEEMQHLPLHPAPEPSVWPLHLRAPHLWCSSFKQQAVGLSLLLICVRSYKL